MVCGDVVSAITSAAYYTVLFSAPIKLGWWWGKGANKLKVNKIYTQADDASSHVIFVSSSLYKTHGSTPPMTGNLLQLTNLSSIAFIAHTEIQVIHFE